jgi:hypothetical protein
MLNGSLPEWFQPVWDEWPPPVGQESPAAVEAGCFVVGLLNGAVVAAGWEEAVISVEVLDGDHVGIGLHYRFGVALERPALLQRVRIGGTG